LRGHPVCQTWGIEIVCNVLRLDGGERTAEEVFVIDEEAVREVEERQEMMPMEGAKHRLVRSEGMDYSSGEGEPFEGGSATRRKSTRD
jgi:hypothetical protein